MKKNYLERQNAFATAFNIAPGTVFKITKKAEGYKDGWDNAWAEAMTKTIGKNVVVKEIWANYGIRMTNGYSYPFFVLQHVRASKEPVSVRVQLNDSHSVVVGKDKIVVGCQSFKTDIVKKLQDALDELNAEDLIAEKPSKPQMKKKKVKAKRKK